MGTGVVFIWGVLKGLKCKSYFIEFNDFGEVRLNQTEGYRLLPSSRLSWLGCWLLLMDTSVNNRKTKVIFVYKDSLTRREYTRLCRWVLRFNLNKRPELKQ